MKACASIDYERAAAFTGNLVNRELPYLFIDRGGRDGDMRAAGASCNNSIGWEPERFRVDAVSAIAVRGDLNNPERSTKR